MKLNTIKTSWGFLVSLLGKYTGLGSTGTSIDDIYNYLQIDERIATSGQPTAQQFPLIKSKGFTTVINLAPHDAENSVKDEASRWADLGLDYIHIPVNFKNPTDTKFAVFAEAMKAAENKKVWVHCAANMRVSAFIYRYRTETLGENQATARQDMDKIWEPFGVWKEFVENKP